MIQLATDPNASRSNWRPAAGAKEEETTLAGRRPRGHAWPFISRYAERPAQAQEPKQTHHNESGS